MARITPKTNWVGADIPVAPDLNRIENNNEQAFADIDQEVSDRQTAITAEENARQSAINIAIAAEKSERIDADNLIVSNLTSTGAIGSYALMRFGGSGTILPGTVVNGSDLRYTSSSSIIFAATIPPGTWRCMGTCYSSIDAGRTTLFVRIS
jgi:hypothetical protein